jgi:hypothetical protein
MSKDPTFIETEDEKHKFEFENELIKWQNKHLYPMMEEVIEKAVEGGMKNSERLSWIESWLGYIKIGKYRVATFAIIGLITIVFFWMCALGFVKFPLLQYEDLQEHIIIK